MKKYKLIVPAIGLPAGTVFTGPVADVLVNNGKAVPVIEDDPKPEKKKEGAK